MIHSGGGHDEESFQEAAADMLMPCSLSLSLSDRRPRGTHQSNVRQNGPRLVMAS